jgi:hypothetical protein
MASWDGRKIEFSNSFQVTVSRDQQGPYKGGDTLGGLDYSLCHYKKLHYILDDMTVTKAAPPRIYT